MLTLAHADLEVALSPFGAELQSVRWRGTELLWQGGPAWPRRSPVLFPAVGRLAGDRYRLDGATHPLGQHGFARDRDFTVVEQTTTSLAVQLRDDDETRAWFPYAFSLLLRYELTDRLRVGYTLEATDGALDASLGAHPALAWPLFPGVDKSAHTVTFAEDEPAPVRRLDAGLLSPRAYPSPVRGAVLQLDEQLFADDALIFDQPRSREVVYTAPGCPTLTFSWAGFDVFALWSKVSGPRAADFLCLEPWRGHADPVGFDGDWRDKPGSVHLEAGDKFDASWNLRVTG